MVNKSLIVILIVFLIPRSVLAQNKRIEKANENFDNYAFIDARKIYLDVANSGYESSDLLKKLADSYYFNAELEKAAPWYTKLVSKYENDINPEYLFRYSQSLKSIQQYNKADQVMEKFNAITNNDNRAQSFKNKKDYLNFIELQSGKFRLSKLNINSKYSDYAPSFNHQGQLIFASSRKSSKMSKTIHEWNEMPFLNLLSSDTIQNSGILKNPKKLKGKINTKFHESSTSFSKDGKTVYFTRNNYTKRKLGSNTEGVILLKMYRASLINDKWTNIEELPFNSDEFSVAHPALNNDETKLYFASDMPNSKGLSDIYLVDINEDGTFGEPKNLGDHINTEGRETFPYISSSGKLYFASDGHIGLGGLDVFVSMPEEFNMFSTPFNIGKPVNSPEDDFTFIIDESTKTGYFASNRTGGKGNDDIYKFKQTEDLITKCGQYVSGTITDAITREILSDSEIILMDENNVELQKTISDNNGIYRFDLPCKSSFVIRGAKESYSPTEIVFDTDNTPEFTHQLPLQLGKGNQGLEKIEMQPGDDLSKLLKLEPIYFDLDKSFIRPDAEIELQKIIATLNQYPQLKIDVRSHTDSRANDNYNMYLSERRAKSTIKYIIEKGKIDSSRITGRGYGETSLVNKCVNGKPCKDQDHERNRRSEFIVIK